MTDSVTSNPDLAETLLGEFCQWFSNLALLGTVLPKAFSGVNPDGKQFIVALSDLELDTMEHLDFMRYVLHAEKSIAFVFKMRMIAQLSKEPEIFQEQHQFISGQQGSYHNIGLTSKDGESWESGTIICNESHSKEPEMFFQELLQIPYSPTENDKKYAAIWNSVRDRIKWQSRV